MFGLCVILIFSFYTWLTSLMLKSSDNYTLSFVLDGRPLEAG